jgi:probable HAF family extracellular repeat protein
MGVVMRGELAFVGRWVGVLSVLLVSTIVSQAMGETQYNVTDLGSIGPNVGAGVRAYGINASSQVTGYGNVSNDPSTEVDHPFLYSGGTIQDLGTLPGAIDAQGFAINNAGWVVGGVDYPKANSYQGFLFNGTTMISLGMGGTATGINSTGQVVGQTSNRIACRVDTDSSGNPTSITDLGSLSPADNSTALGINDAGVIVGLDNLIAGGSSRPWYWNGSLVELPGLGGTQGQANAINNSGVIVGSSTDSSGTEHAVEWSGASITDLGLFPGVTFSQANAINDLGEDVVGSADASGAPTFGGAALWQDGQMLLLNTLIDPNNGWRLDVATGINDAGDIVGFGSLNGVGRAYLLTPIPEPGTAATLLLGIAYLNVARRERQKV